MHRGGIAGKLGDRYEARWTVWQALGLLDGSALSITLEKLGEDGFEFELARSGGREWHQCKRQTARGHWPIAALAAEGVLGDFASKLAGSAGQCVFVSGDRASQLASLQAKLPATNRLDAFEASLSKDEAGHWLTLCDRLGGSPADALDFLARTDFKTLGEPEIAEMVRSRIAYWFLGDPENVAAELRVWVEDDHNFNRPLTRDDLLAFADRRGIAVKQYELDRTLPGRIRDQTRGYRGSYRALGAGLVSIPRPAAGDVLRALEGGAPVVLLAGSAGVGKSAVLSEVITGLEAAGTLHLAFRVDQAGEPASLDALGSQLVGTADNPGVVLEQLSRGQRTVLIVDQADAVSEISGRTASLRRVLLDLIRQCALYSHVQIVFSCRSYDLDNDHAFRALADAPGNVRIDLAPFPQADVERELDRLSILYDRTNVRLMALLCLPIGLTLAAELSQAGITDLRTVEHLSELYERLLHARDDEVQRGSSPGWSIFPALTALARDMSARQGLAAPLQVLDDFPRAARLLEHAGLIVVRGRRVSFMHESLFDFLHARDFVYRGENLVPFLLASEQTLFRRTQTRQILAFEREHDRPRYLADLEAILTDRRIRAHIRETIVLWLATLPDPDLGEWALVARYAAGDGLPRRAGPVINRRKGWFDLLRAEGIVDQWLTTDGEDLVWTLGFLLSIAPFAADEVATLLRAFMIRRSDGAAQVLVAMRWIDPQGKSGVLADCLIMALEQAPRDGDDDDWGLHFGSWVKPVPLDAARLLRAKLDRWFRHHADGHPFERDFLHGGSALHWLKDLAAIEPAAFLHAILPAMNTAIARHVEGEGIPARNGIWPSRRLDRTDLQSPELIDLVADALARVAADDPDTAARLLALLEPDRYLTGLHLLLETVTANPEDLAPLLVAQLDNPGLFLAGWHCAEGYSAAKAMTASIPYLDALARARCEAAIFALRPELDFAAKALADHRRGVRWFSYPDFPRHCLRDSGLREWSVLRQIGSDLLSPIGGRRLAELDRKFVGRRPEEPDGMHGGWVCSPIDPGRAQRMNDAAWLSAIADYSVREPDIWDRGGLRGGSRELARVLKERAKDEPDRFISLLVRLPDGARDDFACGVVAGITETKPDAATVERILAIVSEYPQAQPGGQALAWLIRSCSEPPGPLAQEMISALCLGEEDERAGEFHRAPKDEKEPDWQLALNSGGDLLTKAINSPRGSALAHVGEMAWESKEAFQRYRPVFDQVVGSSAPPYVHAALETALLAGLKHEGKESVGWLRRTIAACPQALFNNNGRRALHLAFQLDAALGDFVVESYIESADPLVRAFGALTICQFSLGDARYVPLAERLIAESVEYRSAAAVVAAANFQSERFGGQCSDWLIRFFDDDATIVRHQARDCFRRLRTEDVSPYRELFERFAASRYFAEARSSFVHTLERLPERMDDLLLHLLEQTVSAKQGRDGTAGAYDLYDIGTLLLRIYVSSIGNADRVRRTLDLVDQLVELGLMAVVKLDAT